MQKKHIILLLLLFVTIIVKAQKYYVKCYNDSAYTSITQRIHEVDSLLLNCKSELIKYDSGGIIGFGRKIRRVFGIKIPNIHFNSSGGYGEYIYLTKGDSATYLDNKLCFIEKDIEISHDNPLKSNESQIEKIYYDNEKCVAVIINTYKSRKILTKLANRSDEKFKSHITVYIDNSTAIYIKEKGIKHRKKKITSIVNNS